VRRDPSGDVPETRKHKGFWNIRILRGDVDPNQFVLIEEWDEAQNFHDYIQSRTETGDAARLLAMTVSPPQMGIWALIASAQAQLALSASRLGGDNQS
jgi:quinol monooxygenase YgiN